MTKHLLCFSGTITFPPPTMAVDDKTVDDIKNREKQVLYTMYYV